MRANRRRFPFVATTLREKREFCAVLSWTGCLAGILFLGLPMTAAQARSDGLAPSVRPIIGEGTGGSPSGDPRSAATASRSASVAGEGMRDRFPYTYVGAIGEEGAERKIVLQGDFGLSIVGTGDVVDGAYRIEEIHRDGMEVIFLSTNKMLFVPYSEIAPPLDAGKRHPTQNLSTVRSVTKSDEPLAVDPPKGATLEEMMDLRPPGEAMETVPASAGEDMLAMPPSKDDVHP